MPADGHVHRMEAIAWSTPLSEFPPAVVFGCTNGICDKTQTVRPKKRDRKVPPFMTPEQFNALKQGTYWPEITHGAE